jgi:FAD/FMN-containing dehydrogenase
VAGLDRRDFLSRAGGGALLLAAPEELWQTLAQPFGAEPSLSRRALRELRRALRGPVLLPGTPGYGRARLVFNARFNGVRPRAVVQPRDARDVRAAVAWAERYGVRLVPRSGGHSYAGYSTASKGVVVDLRRLRGIRVDTSAKRATVGAGARLIDVYTALARHGVTVPAGTCPTVGLAGLALGGGYGLASRRLGLTADNLRALTIVTADARLRRVDRESEPELFWACRGGGGGNFGIVTGMELRMHRARSAAWFRVSWPWSAASAAIDAWQRFAPHAPDRLTSLLSVSSGPRISAQGQFFGSAAELRRVLRPLTRVGGTLSMGMSAYLPLMLRWAGGRSSPRAAFWAKSDYVNRPLPARARAAMVRRAQSGSGVMLLDAYGGAINRLGEDDTAFVHRDQLFSIQYLSYAGPGWVAGARRALRPYVSGEAYQNYIDGELGTWQRAYYGRNLPRLREVKKRYDPDFRFRFPQAIPPAR